MSHGNARLTPTGRRIIIERVQSGRPIAHVAKELGISRTCAHRWVNRYRAHGWDGLEDRSSRPKSCPRATPQRVVADVVAQRHPRQNGKAERFNRTLQEGWAYRQPFTSNQARTDALQPWLDFYNNHRPHGSLGGKPPSAGVTNLLAEYT